MATFSKPAQTPASLLAKLEAQGLVINDHTQAIRYLTFVGHYRLKGYWFHLIDPATKIFKAGTTFDMIRDRYEFDREIRALILEAVERLEVAVRGAKCNHLSLKYSPHWYLEPRLFKTVRGFGAAHMLSKIRDEVGRSKDKDFIAAYFRNYDAPDLPPSWAMSECVTFGIWSRMFEILADPADRKAIAARFGIQEADVFKSWLHTLAVLRNMAAHHDRFIGRKLGVGPKDYKKRALHFADNKSVYAALTAAHVLLAAIGFNSLFRTRLVQLHTSYGAGMTQELGFPNNWPIGAIGW